MELFKPLVFLSLTPVLSFGSHGVGTGEAKRSPFSQDFELAAPFSVEALDFAFAFCRFLLVASRYESPFISRM